MQINIKRVLVTIPDDQVARIVMDYFTNNGVLPVIIPPDQLQTINVPPIGSVWSGQGGIFTGLARSHNGQPDCLIITGPEIEATTWEKSKAAAATLEIDGHKDFSLPFRTEQSLQFANVPELFEKEWYWSCEQHADNADWAWMQYFDYGYQSLSLKDGHCRARAVRRLIIQ